MSRYRLVFNCIGAAVSAVALPYSCWPDSYSLRPISTISPVTARAVVGCWQFDRGAKFLEDRVASGSVVQLDSVVDSSWTADRAPTAYRVRVLPVDSAKVRRVRDSGWGLDAADDRLIRVWIGDGFSGSRLRLRLHDTLLTGDVRGYSDVSPDLSFRHSVRGRQVACPRANIGPYSRRGD
jgi:hypothetical protein